MLRYITRNHILLGFGCLLVFSGILYIRHGPSISSFCFCPDNGHRRIVQNKMNTDLCQDNGNWKISELKMQTGVKYAQPSTTIRRTDVNSVTNWNAPLVWEGTFDPVVIDVIYKRMDPRVAVVLFAVGKYTRFLKGFLESAEKHFLVDFRVTYYIFTDNKGDVPQIELAKGRNISVITVPSAKRWQEVVLGRMKWATITIDKQIRNEADYLYMMDIDSVFHNRVGAESFSQLSAVLHRGYMVLLSFLQYIHAKIAKGLSFLMSAGPNPRPSFLLMKETTITLLLSGVDTWRTCIS
ncbi:globoside alpha-1,3-N-acetylgalactosaminyltransferase 1-like isoform X2 [Anarrhichthys ocellatus]|uniref:globoside alpha-1,3-N-acetylgalactosaminyltransferase 1-like isoform X2 n=1 Tax=Anarrhichthys ocellatus TaxID=433405 RepID=UPI0012EE90BC|nr:globoside alpha-1,3-N-acetylgalactosaminyltransferase 1-like isoform X2 [Anarrhichthys ocellatus]